MNQQNLSGSVPEKKRSPLETVADWLLKLKRDAGDKLLLIAQKLEINFPKKPHAVKEIEDLYRQSGDLCQLAMRAAEDLINMVLGDGKRRRLVLALAEGNEPL